MPTQTAPLDQLLANAAGAAVTASRLDLDADPEGVAPAEVYVAACDLTDAGSIAAAAALASRLSGPLVLVVDAGAQPREMRAALRAGVAGLVREAEAPASLAGTLQAVVAGQFAAPRDLVRRLERPILSRRQKQVLGLVVLGLSNGEIAAKMHLSEHTVKCHLYASFRRLGVSSRDEAASLILDPEQGLGTGILTIPAERR
jgi:DNA-binding NarL/FixJ family response regulator